LKLYGGYFYTILAKSGLLVVLFISYGKLIFMELFVVHELGKFGHYMDTHTHTQ